MTPDWLFSIIKITNLHLFMLKYRPVKISPRQRKAPKKFFLFLIFSLIILGLFSCLWFVYELLKPVNLKQTHFVIRHGQGINQISYRLRRQGIIDSSFVFETYVYLKGAEDKFKAGEYDLPQVANIKRLTEIFMAGQPAKEWRLTVPEGWTAKDIAYKLENLGKFQAEEFLEAVGVGQPDNHFTFDISGYDFLADKPADANLEGYLFPDTYRFFNHASVDDVVRKMLDNFGKKLTPQMRRDIKRQHKTIFEIITLASIVEREAKFDRDRPIIAGIFWKRLELGMPLQADSTLNYITGKKTPAVSAKDLKLDSPYNTYKYRGLPPGPIGNPGLDAIKAAIYPQKTDYLYFLTDSHGNVYYAKTFEEHVRNKQKYLK